MRAIALLFLAVWPAASPAQTLIVGNKVEHSISLIDLAKGREVIRLPTGRAPHEIAVSPDGRTAVAVSYREQGFAGDTLHLFDIPSGKPSGTIKLDGHRGLHGLKWIGRTNRLIATSEITRNVAVVDVAQGKLVASIDTGQDGSHMVALSPDGTRAFVANIGSGSFSAIDLTRNSKIRDVPVGRGAEAITVTPDGREIWVGANEDKKIVIFDARTLKRLAEIATAGVPIRTEVSPNGKQVAVSEPDLGRLSVYDRASRSRVATIDLGKAGYQVPVTMLFSTDGRTLWVAATGSEAVAEVTTGIWQIRRRLGAGKGSDGLGYSRLSSRPGN